jgi:hypothetical protein
LTKELYNKILESKANGFIYISSAKAAADSVDGLLTQDTFPNPIAAYVKSILIAELRWSD